MPSLLRDITPPFVDTALASDDATASVLSPNPKKLNPLLTALTAGCVTVVGPSLHPPMNCPPAK